MNASFSGQETTENDIAKEADNDEDPKEELDSRNAEKAYSCVLCERTFSTANGLKSHEGKIHKASLSLIPQTDGLEEVVCYEDYAFKSEYGEEDIEDSLDKIQEKTKVNVKLISIVRSTTLGTVHDGYTPVYGTLSMKIDEIVDSSRILDEIVDSSQ